jgi:hypothetical protein
MFIILWDPLVQGLNISQIFVWTMVAIGFPRYPSIPLWLSCVEVRVFPQYGEQWCRTKNPTHWSPQGHHSSCCECWLGDLCGTLEDSQPQGGQVRPEDLVSRAHRLSPHIYQTRSDYLSRQVQCGVLRFLLSHPNTGYDRPWPHATSLPLTESTVTVTNPFSSWTDGYHDFLEWLL